MYETQITPGLCYTAGSRNKTYNLEGAKGKEKKEKKRVLDKAPPDGITVTYAMAI
jgi:hypothetical protein